MSNFDDTVISAVTEHMNDDHTDDSMLIARAFGYPEATSSVMVNLSGDAGIWRVTDPAGEHELSVAWPSGAISERPEIRREVVLVYRAACEKLGISPRQEHESAPAQGGTEGAHAHGAATPAVEISEAEAADAGPNPLSKQLREGSWSDHSDSEGANFMENIMRAKATLDDYTALAVQHFYMYEAIEEAANALTVDPKFAAFHPAGLVRMAALEDDLKFLIGDDWRDKISPVPATTAYAARIREVAAENWLAGFVAHHYTRYLGDLSGGQMISRRVAKQHGFTGPGIEFYSFPELGDLNEFKNDYRAALDALGEGMSEEERQRMVEEVRTAYRFNTEVFIDLARAKATAAA